MQITTISNEGLKREYSVKLPAEKIAKATELKIAEISKDIALPGFRPGKVPLNLIRQKYSKAVQGEVLEKLVDESVKDVFKEKDEEPAMRPQVEVVSFEENADFEFKISYETLPAIPDFKEDGVEVEALVVQDFANAVQEALDKMSSFRKNWVKVDENREIALGDGALIDYEGSVNGVPFDGGKAEGFTLELGSGMFIPGFEEQVVGMKVGEERVIKVKFPEDYQNDDLKGADTEFKIFLHEIQKNEPIIIDDEFAKQIGYDSLDELKQMIEKNIKNEIEEISGQITKKRLFDILDSQIQFEVPSSMFDAEFNSLWKQAEEAAKMDNGGVDLAEQEKEKLKKRYELIANRRVRLGLLLSDIGKKNSIKISEDELKEELFRRARMMGPNAQRFMQFYQQNPEMINNLYGPILEDKVVKLLLSMIAVNEKVVTIEELNKAQEDIENEFSLENELG